MKTLVIYYSLSGNTKLIAETIAKEIGADILELKTKNSLIGKIGFLKYFWGGKQVIMKETPELMPLKKDFAKYDLIFIGTPVWAFSFAPPLKTLFSKRVVQNKKVALFCSHGGGIGKTIENMKKEMEGNDFVGQIDFLEPLHEDTKGKIELTKVWAKSIVRA